MNGREEGHTLILLGIISVGLALAAVFALDGSLVYDQRRRIQHAAEASALSGAQTLAAARHEAAASPQAIDEAVSRQIEKAALEGGIATSGQVEAAYVIIDGDSEERRSPVPVGNALSGGPGTPEEATGVVVTTTAQLRTFSMALAGKNRVEAHGEATTIINLGTDEEQPPLGATDLSIARAAPDASAGYAEEACTLIDDCIVVLRQ